MFISAANNVYNYCCSAFILVRFETIAWRARHQLNITIDVFFLNV